MTSVTYKKQPGIAKTNGSIPLAGTKHLYTVSGVLWPNEVEAWIAERLIGTTLHVCSGKSQLGDVRLDLFEENVDVWADAARLPFADGSFDTVLIDPPYNYKFQWNHDMLNELHRIARVRIIFQHHFSPVDKQGQFKKAHRFTLTEAAVVPDMPSNLAKELSLAVKVDGVYYVVEEANDGKVFRRTDLAYWQPRTYFGRVQLISVLTAVDYEPISTPAYQQLPLPGF